MKRLFLVGALVTNLFVITTSADETFRFPTIGTKADGRATLLAIDSYSLPLKKDLCFYMSKPKVRPEAVLKPQLDDPNAPDHVATHFYGTVIHDNGIFRMWYYPMSWRVAKSTWREGPPCYAESDDGLHWKRPNLGQVSFNGSTNNNILKLPESDLIAGAFVIRDDADPDAARRYKMAYEYLVPEKENVLTASTATSPDGLHWTAGPDAPIDAHIEPCALYKHNDLYFINAHYTPNYFSEGGHSSGREGFVWLSTDFKTWLRENGESFALPVPADPIKRSILMPDPQVHLGTAPVSMGNVLVGLYGRWHHHEKPNDWFGFGETAGDLGIVVSHDGQHFREPVKSHVFMSREESMPDVPEGIKYQNCLCQGNGILNVGDQTLIYHGRWANTEKTSDYYAEIGLATLPRDRWGAVGLVPNAAKGTVWSAPVALPESPCELTLNGDGLRGIHVEIADERFALLPGFSEDDSGEVKDDDGLDASVEWSGDGLKKLAGKTVRFRIHLERGDYAEPRLYACYLTVKSSDRAASK